MPKTKLKIYCVWCRRYIGEKDEKGVEGISHTICEECTVKVLESAKKDKEKKDGCGNKC